MKKKTILFLSTMLALSLTGCSGIKNLIKNQILQQSGVLEEDDYKKYEEYEAGGNLDDEGYYIEKASEETQDHAQIHVTFAENNNLNVRYYTDAEHKDEVDPADCYLNPGSSVYAVVTIDDEVFSSMYEFSEFRIFEIDNEGGRKESSSLKMTGSDTEQVMKIPDSFEGTDIVIEPIGTYQQRTISFHDYWSDDDNNKTDLAGPGLSTIRNALRILPRSVRSPHILSAMSSTAGSIFTSHQHRSVTTPIVMTGSLFSTSAKHTTRPSTTPLNFINIFPLLWFQM